MSNPVQPSPGAALPRRRWPIISGAVVLGVIAAVVLALFQPWKLWVDDQVDEAAPAGAVPIAVVPASSVPASVSSTPPTTVASGPVATAAAPTAAAPTATAPPTIPAPAPAPASAFVGIDHGTSGAVVLLQDEAGTQFVRLESLDTSNGPDLFVYLSTNPHDGPEGQFDDDYVNLGRLEGNVGSSNYAVPAGTDLSRYASVVIWCDRFNSAFGAAPLI